MQIEETFRDLKSPAYGLGLRHSRTSSSERFDIMLLIALMLQLTCWLAGVHAQKQGWDKHFQANTVRNRNVLSTVRLGMEVLRHSGYNNNKGRLTRGCNPTSSKFIHTWLRFGEIMRGSLSALPPIPIIYYADNNLV